jgi:hypothetical protein
MRPARRFRLIGAAVAAVELTLGALLVGTNLEFYFWACAAASLALALIAGRFLETPPPGPDDDRRGGSPGPESPVPPDPPWWPEFERRLREYSRESRDAAPAG